MRADIRQVVLRVGQPLLMLSINNQYVINNEIKKRINRKIGIRENIKSRKCREYCSKCAEQCYYQDSKQNAIKHEVLHCA